MRYETLVAALREWGIRFLGPSDAQAEQPLEARELIEHLAAHEDARLRAAPVPLFILHPRLATDVTAVLPGLAEPAQHKLMAAYMAAVYLQRMWHIRLGFYLPQLDRLPDLFSARLGLPPPEERYGKTGLYALAEWCAAHSPILLTG